MKRPFVFIGTAMFISLLIYSYHGIPAAVVMFIVALILSLPAFLLRNKRKKCLSILCITLAVLTSSLLFSLKTVYEYLPAISLCSDKTHTIQGTLTEYEFEYGNHYYTLDNIKIDNIPTKHRIRINSDVWKNTSTDDILIFTDATIYELGTNQKTNLYYKAESVYIGAYTDGNITVIKASDHSVLYYLQSIRNFITHTLGKNMYPEYAAVTDAILTGNQTAIGHDTMLDFRYSGISHLFAVSGFHLALWSSLVKTALLKLLKKHKNTAYVLTVVFVIFFMALTGFSKSVTRSGIMLILMYAGNLIKHRTDSINSLFIAITLILTFNPFAVTSLALQMSFLATLGILTLSEPVIIPIKKLKTKLPSVFYNIILTVYTTVVISVIATIFTMPVSALNFGYYSPFSPVSNLLCLPAAQLLMILSGFALVISPIHFIARPVFVICNFLVKYILSVTSAIAHYPYAITDTDPPMMMTILLIILTLTAVFLIIFKNNNNKNLRRCVAISASAILLLSVVSEITKTHSYEITVADVGNGTSVILSTGKSDVIIGCGGNDHSDYRFTNCADRINQREFDLILIPKNTDTESEYAFSILNTYKFNSCIIADDGFSGELKRQLPENTQITNECTVKLDENTTLVYINNDRFSGARIKSPDFTATILFRPTSDFSTVGDIWQSGDLLITRQNLPQTNLDGFENIIVSTSSEINYNADNIFSTEILGNIRYIKFPTGGVSINAVQ
ncbi:MAG: ComEC/Rec2 family competence protein [Clostridia bacterium]|nr:ComEC/Rec2 family competence protein [Clostridia bacterium]